MTSCLLMRNRSPRAPTGKNTFKPAGVTATYHQAELAVERVCTLDAADAARNDDRP